MATTIESFLGNYLLNKLAVFVEEKVGMIKDVNDELDKLKDRMSDIAAYLEDADKRRITHKSVSNWLNKLKDVMYDFDDMLDLWIYKNQSLLPCDESATSSNSQTCCSFPLFSCFRSIQVRHEVAQQIKILNDRLEKIFKDRANLHLQHLQSAVRDVHRTGGPLSSSIIDTDVVGTEVEESANKLVKMAIADDKQKINLIAITGMGGIGKTTLAQKIYNDNRITKRYAKKIWLSVTQSYSIPQLIKKTIRLAEGDPNGAETEDELLPILANVVSGKSFFLVLDDIWNPDSVKSLLNAMKSKATYIFITVTTRNQEVAMRMGAKYIHEIELLSPKSGWELLCRKSYLTDPIDIQQLQDIGTQIVTKCGGLPLAVIAMAGLLSTKNKSKNKWEDVLKSSAWSISGLPEEINRALYLSYSDLSPQLKQCFLYCSLYPSNYVMTIDDLIRFWISEGFVEEKSDHIVENIAEEYYHELIRRNFLNPDYIIVDYSECKMHDLFRSLAQYLSKEESFSGDDVFPDDDVIFKLRRLSISEVNEQTFIPSPVIEQLKLRTFVIFECLSEIKSDIFIRLKYLRVLYINEKGLHSVPESIGVLIHLRMLDLDRTSISNLPESIGSLTNLLFLNLSGCECLHTLPRGITRLCNLRQLNLDDTPLTNVPKGLNVLTKLTEIIGFQVGGYGGNDEVQNGWSLQELEGLSQLRRLLISNLERARNFSTVLENKRHLKELQLRFSEEFERGNDHAVELEDENYKEIIEKLCPPSCLEKLKIFNYNEKMLPSWMSSFSMQDNLANIQYVQLTNWLFCTDLPPLGILPQLKYLEVQGASSIVRISSEFVSINIQNDFKLPVAFPKLEYLKFIDMPNWEEWRLPDFGKEKSPSWQLMPRIKLLEIEKCPKLRALPEGLQQISTIEDFIVREAHNLKSIQDLTFECEYLTIDNIKCLEILSNLPRVKNIYIGQTHNLRQVSKLDSVEYVELEDYALESLPEWLVNLMEERKQHLDYKLHLELFCKTTLLIRCIKHGLEWPIIKCFSSVNIYNEEKNASIQYTKEPESYIANV